MIYQNFPNTLKNLQLLFYYLKLYDDIKIDETVGYTGHQNIQETNLVDMRARIYDPEIARFIQTDSIIPDSNKVVAYNRYAYVNNNPVNYIDPDGHNPFAFFAIGATIFTVGATMEDSTLSKALMVVGSVMMGRANLIGTSAFANGAATGFTTGFILSGGELDKAVQNGVISGVTAAATYEVGHGGKDNKPLFGDNFVATAIAHGVVQGIASELRGGDFRSGFVSGVVGKVAGHYAKPYMSSNVVANASIIGMIGGIASEASGGDFYEGAKEAVFVYLFNDSLKFNGKNLIHFDDNNKILGIYPAESGRVGTTPKDQHKKNVGPIPEGEYYINPKEISGVYGIKYFLRNLRGDWGTIE